MRHRAHVHKYTPNTPHIVDVCVCAVCAIYALAHARLRAHICVPKLAKSPAHIRRESRHVPHAAGARRRRRPPRWPRRRRRRSLECTNVLKLLLRPDLRAYIPFARAALVYYIYLHIQHTCRVEKDRGWVVGGCDRHRHARRPRARATARVLCAPNKMADAAAAAAVVVGVAATATRIYTGTTECGYVRRKVWGGGCVCTGEESCGGLSGAGRRREDIARVVAC